MHLSCEEVLEKVFNNSRTAEDFERWEETFLRPSTMVHSDVRTAEASDSSRVEAGGIRRATELHPKVGWNAQWNADRALWLAAEPVPIEGAIGPTEQRARDGSCLVRD